MGNDLLEGPLPDSAEPQFAELCRDTRAGFTDALDLVLIHNERRFAETNHAAH